MKLKYCVTGLLFLQALPFLTISPSYSQTPSSCSVPAILKTEYPLDIGHLTLMRLDQLNSPYYDSITIPQIYQDTIWEGLAAIFNATSIPERDSVFDIYCIHQNTATSFIRQTIYVYLDTTYAWTQQWQNLQTITGYGLLDTFLSQYGFSITYYYSASNSAKLISYQIMNEIALCDSLASFDGIIYAEQVPGIGGGNIITYSINDTMRDFQFILGFGDCLSGCTSFHVWKFRVYNDCSVSFLGSTALYNDPFPSTVNCNITTGIKYGNHISESIMPPSPSYGIFTLSNLRFYVAEIEIYSILGEKILSRNIQDNKTFIDLSSHPSGIYFVKLQTANNLFTQKIIINK